MTSLKKPSLLDFKTQYGLALDDTDDAIIVDLFAGGGGASTGLEMGLGRKVDLAINHNPAAISMHEANHPHAEHLPTDVWGIDPIASTKGKTVGWLHASPDCRHHSQAAGGQPRKKEIRDLSWVVVKWAGKLQKLGRGPWVISLENVKQILQWGPLIAKRDKATGRVVRLDGTVAQPGERVPRHGPTDRPVQMLPLPAAGAGATGDTTMSSTQHQLIEQCATRLRGIVEALDNIHDTSPQRWSTDLDDVRSSAESLLTMIKDQAPPPCIDCKGTGFCNSISGEEIRCPCRAPIRFADPAQAEQAEAERPEGVESIINRVIAELGWSLDPEEYADMYMLCEKVNERIVGELRAHIADLEEARDSRVADRLATLDRLTQERDAALANVDALAVQVLKLGGTISFDYHPVAQAVQVPQAWLDVQAERRRQVEAEGWTPEHDDEHACDEIAAFACFYAMPPAARDWDASSTGYGDTLGEAILPEGWEPKTGDRRRDLVKACALALAEIERLDRAGISQNPQPGATTASS
ncbi:TPA: DNA cytosine methyltransferase [Pseudomonas aeruginosa]